MTDVEIIAKLQEIKEESSSTGKEAILKQCEDNDFKKVLKYLYDPSYVFGISGKKINKKVSVELKKDCNTILEVFEYLEENNTGTDFDVFVVQSFLNKSDKHLSKDILIEMFCKKYKIGVTIKTLEKVYPDLFTKYEVMTGEPFDKRLDDLKAASPEIIITQKFDGIRGTARVENGNVKIFARSGKLILGLKDLEKELSKLPDGAYDGELLKDMVGTVVDTAGFPEKSICHKIYCPKNAEELYGDTVSIVNSKSEDKKDVRFYLFDMISLENFDTKTADETPTEIRKDKLQIAIEINNFRYVKYAPILYKGIFNLVAIDSMLELVTKILDQEGLMLNYADAPYEFKRTSKLIKIKQCYSVDAKVIGFEEGTGKNKGKLGAFIIKTPQGVEVKVGSGIDDEDRVEVWSKQEGYMGTIIEVAFTSTATNKENDLYNLRFPRFKRWRYDKEEENWEMFNDLIKGEEE